MQIRASVAAAAIVLASFGLARTEGLSPLGPATGTATGLLPFATDLGGAGTIRDVEVATFLRAQPNLPQEWTGAVSMGRQLFRQGWTPALSFNNGDGLGPLFNAASCESCHRAGGRGPMHTLLLRLSIPPQTAVHQAALDGRQVKEIGDPIYGTQLQERAVKGAPREGSPKIVLRDVAVKLGDGSNVTLIEPTYSANALGYGPLHPDIMMSPRIGPPIIGLGLLEAVAAGDIEALADPNDADRDGISGRPNYALDPVTGKVLLGRFGWKAGTATLRAQTAAAFSNDIGISTSLIPTPHGDCTRAQAACIGMPTGGREGFDAEASETILSSVTLFTSSIGVPARRNADDPKVVAGQRAFVAAGCGGCHTPTLVTAALANPAHRSQRIWPYTDLLLHDMGEGLADRRPEGDATGSEWRTAPLWGIGLADVVAGTNARYLHDGRARNLTEAILWHGGEAKAARDAFATLPLAERDALLSFLRSL
jgi:CxxC motif-containing protein (DUF1111 family)